MIKIGLVNIDTSHPLAFNEILLKEDRARYAGVYNDGFRGEDEVAAFAAKSGAARYDSIGAMARDTDIGFIQGCNWDTRVKHALPFINAGKPVFIDKPIAGNLADCLRLQELADAGAAIIGSSSVRYAGEITSYLAAGEEVNGKTMNIYGTAGVDEFNYGIHIVEAICALAGADAVSSRYIGCSAMDGKRCETWHMAFENGVTATYNTFHGTWQPFELVVMTTKTTHQFRIDTNNIYKALLDNICNYMEGKAHALASVHSLLNSIKAMLAGRLSRENGGGAVRIGEIPAGDPGFDGSLFEHSYAAAARKIYV